MTGAGVSAIRRDGDGLTLETARGAVQAATSSTARGSTPTAWRR